MMPDPVTVSEDVTVEQTAGILLKHRISGSQRNRRPSGLITQTDLFKVIISFTGADHLGSMHKGQGR
jgi:hypothetical protein